MPRLSLKALFAHLVVLCCAGQSFAVSQQFVATSLDGTQTTGELVAWKADQLVLSSEGKQVELAFDQLLNIRAKGGEKQPEKLSRYVELTDGTLLPLSAYFATAHEASIVTPPSGQPLKLSTDLVRVVQLSPRAEENAAFWSDLDGEQFTGDVLVVQQSDEGQVEHLSGVLGDVAETQVNFNWDGQDIPVKRTKVVALAYYHAKSPELPDARCVLKTAEGGRLPVARIEWDDVENTLRVTTTGGVNLTIPLASLMEADYSGEKLVYLSDLEPLKVEWTPRIGLPTSAELIGGYGLPRRDQSFAGSSLALLWPSNGTSGPRTTKTYAKGLALRSRTVADYRIPPGMRRLVAIAGIDPATAGQGNVSLEISADGNILWQAEIDGRDAPIEIDVPLPVARRLRLAVDYGGNLDYGDRLHLIEARMTK